MSKGLFPNSAILMISKVTSRLKVLVLVLASILPILSAQNVSAQMFEVFVAGIPVNCTSHYGEPVAIFSDDSVYQNIGIASRIQGGRPIMVLSPTFMNQIPPQAAVFWFAHECAHHALPIGIGTQNRQAELNADCFAIRNMRNWGLIRNRRDFEAVISTVVGMAGTSMHLPGPSRARLLWDCLNT